MTGDLMAGGDGRSGLAAAGWDEESMKKTHDELTRSTVALLRRWPQLGSRVAPEDLVNDVLLYAWERSRMSGTALPSLLYLKKAVYNRAITLNRRLRRDLLILDGEDAMRKGIPEAAEGSLGRRDGEQNHEQVTTDRHNEPNRSSLREAMAGVRALLDRIFERFRGREVVDYRAVLLLQLRLALAAKVGGAVAEPEQGLSEFVEELLPWSADEQPLTLRPGWPSLKDVWNALRPDVDGPTPRVGADAIGQRIGELLGGADPLGSDAWYKWLQRAKDKAREVISPQEWEELLAPLLPQRGKEPRP
jgi:DNA-directed RNA polymerase specialized sigma24 family protein